ncbi:MAG TPA: polyphosphate polymerase domain-containing protein [Clostridiaceae bacterium]|nr:polyphosphate polymerase domain-containing protein [Clostridiaceae bacterium]
MNKVYRKENKFLISIEEAKKCISKLEKIMLQDKNNQSSGYNIRSLYFDTINDDDYESKISGLQLRRKVRLRTYDPNSDFAKLEIKQKDGNYQLKRSLVLKKEDSCELINQNYKVLLKYKEPFAAECYGIMNIQCYRPKTIVEYKRKAFIAKENNIRITFDYDIKTNEVNYNLFDKKLMLNSAFNESNVVLEVKYDGFLLSYIKDAINSINRSQTQVSKYCLARKIEKYYIYT